MAHPVSGEVHAVAAKGFSLQASAYESSRPSYPNESVHFIVKTLNLGSESIVVDLAAGTGKFTRVFHSTHPEIKLVAVEPVAEMRQKFVEVLPDLPILEGTAAKLPFSDASVNAIVTAQAFHWFSNMDSLREFYRVLKPGGGVALVWNKMDDNNPWLEGFRKISRRNDGSTPQYYKGWWEEVFTHPETSDMFTTKQLHSISFSLQISEDDIWTRVLSTSFIASLRESDQKDLEREVREYVRANIPSSLQIQTAQVEVRKPPILTSRIYGGL